MPVRWTRNALANLENAIEFITTDKPMAASHMAKKIWDASQMLLEQPGLGRPGRVFGPRELIVPILPYIFPCIEKEGTVFILRVMHTSLQWPKKFTK